jgi:hypothetical protein
VARVTRPAHARPSTDMRRARHAPLGRCMYCLATGGPGIVLTEEHLVPRALGGRQTLRDAVCEPCRRLTGRLEQLTLDREFAVPRTLLALKRRRARAKGPGRLPPVALEGAADTLVTLPVDAFPRTFALPAFERAGLLADVDAPRRGRAIDFVACTLALGPVARHTVAAPPPLPDPVAYACAIAKWAYTLAVAELGLACCDTQPMRDLMLGRRADIFAFVGTAPDRLPAARDWLHDVAFHERAGWLVATLALFASAGMAPYEVVVGRLPAKRPDG